MKLAFIFVGGEKEPWLEELSADYLSKLSYFCPTEIVRLKSARQPRASAAQKLDIETSVILKAIRKDDLVIACDERGENVDSKMFSRQLIKFFERGRPRVVILVGGAFGFGPEVRERADWKWSLSSLIFNHQIAQAVVLEQAYRAFAIWKNLPYHNG